MTAESESMAAEGERSVGDVVDQISASAQRSLQNTRLPPFTPKAERQLLDEVSTYVNDLISESVRSARRQGLEEAVGGHHVEGAARHLSSAGGSKFATSLGGVGGILFGAALGNFLTIVDDNTLSRTTVVVTTSTGLVGAVLLTAAFLTQRR